MERNLELRKLPPGVVFDLGQILETGEGWKQLMSVIPSSPSDQCLKYTVEHMNLIETASQKQKRHCTEILLEEWGTSGQKRPYLSDLLKLLVQAQLYRAAEYVSVELLKQEAPARPSSGPAASIHIPEVLPLTQEPQISDWGSVYQKDTHPVSQQTNMAICSNKIKHYSYVVLEAGTYNFSESKKLGVGGFGSVYLCQINNNKTAVKRLYDSDAAVQGISEMQFKNELLFLGSVSHPNLLPLLAYSTDGPFLCLVYEFMPNGSLQDALQSERERVAPEWNERLDIAIGTARGLEYLHTMRNKPLIHRDVKSANVLLDENLIPKVGDFGLAKQGTSGKSVTMNTSTIVGTSAYMAPEVFRGDVSIKGDVFSFGVVLLEIITGLPPYDENRDGCDLASYVDDVDNISLLIDTRPNHPQERIAFSLYELAQKCLLDKKSRPTSTTVVKHLEDLSCA